MTGLLPGLPAAITYTAITYTEIVTYAKYAYGLVERFITALVDAGYLADRAETRRRRYGERRGRARLPGMPRTPDDMLNAALRPVYDALAAAIGGLGDDVTVEGRGSYIPFVRGRQFAAIAAAARDRVDLGLRARVFSQVTDRLG